MVETHPQTNHERTVTLETDPTTYRGVTVIAYDVPRLYAWSDDATGAADIAGSLDEARRKIDAARESTP